VERPSEPALVYTLVYTVDVLPAPWRPNVSTSADLRVGLRATRLARLTAAALLSAIAVAAPRAADPPIRLVDVAPDAGLVLLNIAGTKAKNYLVDSTGSGAAFFDYDNDGDMDVLIVNGSSLSRLKNGGDQMVALYQNDGRGHFTDVTPRSGLMRAGWGMGVCIADYDNDGFQDIYVTALGPNVLWRNTGRGTFVATGQAASVGWNTGCAFGDYDHDGYVDLYVAKYLHMDLEKLAPDAERPCRFMNIAIPCGPKPLPGEPDVLYRNTGKGTFVDVTKAAGVSEPGYYGFGVLFSDLDGDGWPDIYVANDSVPSLFFRNRGNGTFSEEALAAGIAVAGDGREQAGMGVDAGDYDGDGRLDLIKTHFSQDHTTLYRNLGGALFEDVSVRSGMLLGPQLGWGVGFVDIDNDGRLDVFIANGHIYPDVDRTGTSTYLQRNQLYWNAGRGRFRELSRELGGSLLEAKSSRGAAFGDYDNDGDIDVLVVNVDDRPTLLRNDTTGGRWITVRLEGTTSNRDAIGARLTLEAAGVQQTAEVRSGGSYLSQNDMRAHFGLGTARQVDRLVIRWPNGRTETASGLASNQFYVAREGSGVRPAAAAP
jgi:enediyne biosynthesis protein E4